MNTKKELTPYEQLVRALVASGARRLAEVDGPNKGQKHGSELEFWNTPDPRPGRLVIVQRWAGEAGSWDAYIQISESRTDEAIRRVIGTSPAPAAAPADSGAAEVADALAKLADACGAFAPAGVTFEPLDHARRVLADFATKPAPAVRLATADEAREILTEFAEHSGQSFEDVDGQRVYIVPNYITCCPGYAGPVALVHWDGSPDFVTVFTWERAGAGYAWKVQRSELERTQTQLDGTQRSAGMLAHALEKVITAAEIIDGQDAPPAADDVTHLHETIKDARSIMAGTIAGLPELDALEAAFIAMGRAGANADTLHPLRPAWEKARAALKTAGRLA